MELKVAITHNKGFKMENQKIDQKVHQAIVQEIILQRDRAMNDAIQKGADLTLANILIKELQEKVEKLEKADNFNVAEIGDTKRKK